jgi:hypothetical protein
METLVTHASTSIVDHQGNTKSWSNAGIKQLYYTKCKVNKKSSSFTAEYHGQFFNSIS